MVMAGGGGGGGGGDGASDGGSSSAISGAFHVKPNSTAIIHATIGSAMSTMRGALNQQ